MIEYILCFQVIRKTLSYFSYDKKIASLKKRKKSNLNKSHNLNLLKIWGKYSWAILILKLNLLLSCKFFNVDLQFFSRYDFDGDGFITPEDVRIIMSYLHFYKKNVKLQNVQNIIEKQYGQETTLSNESHSGKGSSPFGLST